MVFTREPGGTILARSCASLVLDIQSTGDEVINDKAGGKCLRGARAAGRDGD